MARAHRKPTKLTPGVHKAIVKAIREGMSISRAAEYFGITGGTAINWVKRGEAQEDGVEETDPVEAVFIAFARDVRQAQAYDERQRIKRIAAAGKGGQMISTKTVTRNGTEVTREERLSLPDWKADAWHLERTRPKEWGPRADIYVKLDIQRLVAKYAEQHDLDAEAIFAEAQRLVTLLPMEFDDDREPPQEI